jgi:hypothetical protein
MAAPAVEPFGIHRLMEMPRLADIVVARHGEHRGRKARQQLGAITEILLVVGAVDRDVPAMDDEVGLLHLDPGPQWGPVRLEMALAGAEMGVRDLEDTKHRPISLSPGLGRWFGHVRTPGRRG